MIKLVDCTDEFLFSSFKVPQSFFKVEYRNHVLQHHLFLFYSSIMIQNSYEPTFYEYLQKLKTMEQLFNSKYLLQTHSTSPIPPTS